VVVGMTGLILAQGSLCGI